MKQSHVKLTKQNPLHYQRALAKATLVIKDDRRLLGIPSVRPILIETAALNAIGADAKLDSKVYSAVHPENVEPMLEALEAAQKAAKLELTDLPPIRG
jgi:hypothetical protein